MADIHEILIILSQWLGLPNAVHAVGDGGWNQVPANGTTTAWCSASLGHPDDFPGPLDRSTQVFGIGRGSGRLSGARSLNWFNHATQVAVAAAQERPAGIGQQVDHLVEQEQGISVAGQPVLFVEA